LREDEKHFVLGVIERWLSQQAQMATGDSASPRSSENAPRRRRIYSSRYDHVTNKFGAYVAHFH